MEAYLDNNATTAVHFKVMNEMVPFFMTDYGNPSSGHKMGEIASMAIRDSKYSIAQLLCCDPNKLIFTSCGSESINLAIRGYLADAHGWDGADIITTEVEHPAVAETLADFEDDFNVLKVGVDSGGNFNMDEFKSMLSEKTILVSVIWVNNETGVIFPVEEIAELCKEKNIALHVDATQAVGKLHIDISEIDMDFLTFSGHKINAPKGIACLYSKFGNLKSQITGGGQQMNIRSGTENVPYIVAIGKACELLLNKCDRVRKMRDLLESELLQLKGTEVNGDVKNRVDNVTNISFPRIEADTLVKMLSLKGVYVSSGSACSTNKDAMSPTLKAMGVTSKGPVRFSLGNLTTMEELDYAIGVVLETVKSLEV